MTLSLQLRPTDVPRVDVVGPTPGGWFLSVRLGPDLALYFPGFDAACVTAARQLAAALLTGAEALEQALVPTTEVA